MKIIHSDTSDRSNHINCFKHIKYMTTAAVLTAGLFITGCGSSHAMNTAVDKADKDSYLSANNDNCTVFSIRGDGFYADTYDDWDFPDISSDYTSFDDTAFTDYDSDDDTDINNPDDDADINSSDDGSDSNNSDNYDPTEEALYLDNSGSSDNSFDDSPSETDIYGTDGSSSSDNDSQPEYTNPNAWINNLSASSYNNQLIIVAANGSYANVAMYNKNNDDTWETIVDTNGYVGVDGVGNASEYAHITPSGIYRLNIAFGVNSNPGTALPYTQVDSSYYWVDDPSSDWYNRFVTTNTTTPDWSSAEHIIDYPVPYAYAIAIDYNTSCVKGAGSAIFLHCSNGNPTYGCVSVPQSAMITILNNIRTGCSIIIDEAYNISDY